MNDLARFAELDAKTKIYNDYIDNNCNIKETFEPEYMTNPIKNLNYGICTAKISSSEFDFSAYIKEALKLENKASDFSNYFGKLLPLSSVMTIETTD